MAADLLFKAVDATHPDPAVDARDCTKQWDLVEVGWEGKYDASAQTTVAPTDGGKFAVVRLGDKDPQQVLNFLAARWGATDTGPDLEGGVFVRRRPVRLDGELVPAAVRQQLNQTGRYVTTWAAVRQYVRNKRLNVTAAGEPM
jgi:hypothetical protein